MTLLTAAVFIITKNSILLRFSFLLIALFFACPQVSAEYFSRDGDIVIGFVVPAHDDDGRPSASSTSLMPGGDTRLYYANGTTCSGPLIAARALLVTQFRRIIDDINANVSMLGGFKLGYQIVDSCSLPTIASAQAAKWMAAKVDMDARNYSSSSAALSPIASRPMPFVLGAYTSRVTAPLASILQEVDIPLIDFGSTTPLLSDRSAYRLFARTTPSDKYQATAISSLIFNYLWWNCTHLIYSEGVYGETGAQALREELKRYAVCQATDMKAPVAQKNDPAAVRTMTEIVNQIARKGSPPSSVIICFCEEGTLLNLLIALREFRITQANSRGPKIRFVVVASDTWGISLPLDDVESAADGAITIKAGSKDVPGYGEWVSANFQALLDPATMDPWLDEYVQDKFQISHDQIPQRRSSLSLEPNKVPKDDYMGLMMTALYSGVYALKLLLEDACPPGKTLLSQRCSSSYIRYAYNGRRIYELLPNTTKFLDNFKFMSNLDGQPYYYFYRYTYGGISRYTDFAYWNLDDGVAPYGSSAPLARNWPDTNQPIYAACPPTPGEVGAVTVGASSTLQYCASIYYYPGTKPLPDNTSLNIQCAYYCRQTRVTPDCSQQATTLVATTLMPHTSSTAADSRQTTITALSVILAVAACALVVAIGFLIYAGCKCRTYRKKLRDKEKEVKIATISDITSEKGMRPFPQTKNGAYAAMFPPGSTTSSLTYARRGPGGMIIEVSDVQPSLLGVSLQDELYLVPQSKTASQISHSARIRRIITSLGGTEEFIQMAESFFVPNDQLVFGEAFADGKFAFVYHGTLKRPMPEGTTTKDSANLQDLPVAVKVLKSRDSEDLLDFLKEAFLMQTFHHPNVMELLGISLLFDQPHIVVPLMSNGNLRDFVRQYFSSLSDDRLLNFCVQIAIGMEYLSRNKFIHRDLAARNVLVDSEGLLKIADFGMSRHLQQSDYYKPVTIDRPLPIRWHPPESLQMRVFDERSDVWSFGVVMWEIYSGGMQPYGGLSNNEVVEHIAAGNRLLRPERCHEEVYGDVMLKCWQTAIGDRPSFAQLVQKLGAINVSSSLSNGAISQQPGANRSQFLPSTRGSDNIAFAGSTV